MLNPNLPSGNIHKRPSTKKKKIYFKVFICKGGYFEFL